MRRRRYKSVAGEAPVLAASLSLSAIYLDGAEPSHTPTPTPGPKPRSSSEPPRLIACLLFSGLNSAWFFFPSLKPLSAVAILKKTWPVWTEQGVEDGPLPGPESRRAPRHRCDGCHWGGVGGRCRAVITAAGVECDKQGQMNKRERKKGRRCEVGGVRRWRRFKQGEARTDVCLWMTGCRRRR